MLEGLYALGRSLASFFAFWPIVYTLGATLVGVLIGCMPGLSATLAIALLTTLTIKMAPNDAILILICAYVGTIYGGSRTAILLNIPGTAANAAACLDGYQLARQGRAGRAMGIATAGSVAGSLFGVVCLALLTPTLGGGRALVRGVRVLLARAVRRDDVGRRRRDRRGQGLADGVRGTVRRAHRPGRDARLRSLHVRHPRSRRRAVADPDARRRVRLLRDPDGPQRARPEGHAQRRRLGAAAHPGRAQVLAHDPALGRDRRLRRHPPRGRGGHGGLVVVRRGEAREQGEGAVRQRLDRRPHGGGDRRQRVDSRRASSRRSRSPSPARRPRRC